MKKILRCILMGLSTISLQGARPFVTDDAGTVFPGKYELELGTILGKMKVY
jgi:hypothetical protein